MRRWFAMPFTTLRTPTTAQVRGAVGGCVVGRGEVARSAVSGNFWHGELIGQAHAPARRGRAHR
jgi:hypothetical protein